MANRLNDDSYTLLRTDSKGHKYAVKADNQTDFLRELLEHELKDHSLEGTVTVEVTPESDGFTRIVVNYPPGVENEVIWEFGSILSIAFTGKDFYDVREQDSTEDKTRDTYVVKHRGGGAWL